MEESRAKQIVNELRNEMFAGELQASANGKQIAEELTNLNPNIEMDAKEFGEHVRNGGWRLGLLVARSVEPNFGEGRPSKTGEISPVFKISARAFARQAGNIDKNTVNKYLTAWNLAAADGLVPPVMVPGQSFEFDDEVHTPEAWKKYYKTPTAPNEKNAFIAMNDKVVSFIESLDIDAGFKDYDDQIEVSLDSFRENLARLKTVASNWLIKTDEMARKKNYKDSTIA